jgi:hypothetical protein
MSQFLSTVQMVSAQLIRARMFFVALGGILLLSGMAQASLIPSLIGDPVPIGGGQFRYDYRITLSGDERVDTNATNGATCPGPNNANIQCVPAGTFVTLYDIPEFVNVTSSNPLWIASSQNSGPTPNSFNAGFDSNTVTNAVFTYNGPVIFGPATFVTFSVFTTANGTNPVGNFTSQSTNNTQSSTNGTTDQVIGSVPLPIRVNITAATATVGGKVLSSTGKGIGGVSVTITGSNGGESITVLTNRSGYYSFPNMEAGETYVITVAASRYTFEQSSQVQAVLEDRNDINFTAYPTKQKN